MQKITIKKGWKVTIQDGVILIDDNKEAYEKNSFEIGQVIAYKKSSVRQLFLYAGIFDDGRVLQYESIGDIGVGDKAEYYELATPEETSQFFADLEENTGKVWDAEKCELAEKLKRISMPNSIEIYKLSHSGVFGDGLFIKFGNNRLLGFCDEYFIVTQKNKCVIDKVQCELIPCKIDDLKPGDTVFNGDDCGRLSNYAKYMGDNCEVYINQVDMPDKKIYTESDVYYKVVAVENE